ncbi:hypothetical protein A2975_02705 [Candidatus Woesebacteria bacterium RIFCSPLOWO2_01_FULL_44_14]|uniref:Glycosyltransferase RgtA/B/C/D-like domain-containing protein n=1 Tax=Candidatus Woesebacteria bacterium RIFCSPLOWO2_01_FULL_44_14 TaxID=1802525 RepID=A0A1F8C397_9BACT|nr:MAG: hypothetical protein A2975_02705 [Candidatus Woesebacteria bacterium RIFCSPLOWO2_01_FULL_44_14]
MRKILIIYAIVCLATIFVWNVTSDDLFSYIFSSRIFSKFGVNPYYVPYDTFKSDALYSSLKTVWSSKTFDHGPALLLLGTVLTKLAGDNLFLNIYLFKITLAIFNFLTGYLLYKISHSKKAFLLYAFNPVVLWDLGLDSHDEALVIFFLALSLFLFFQNQKVKNNALGFLALTASFLVKFTVAIFAPFYTLFFMKNKQKNKWLFLFGAGVLSLILVALAHLPFWDGLDIYQRTSLITNAEFPYPAPGIFLASLILPFHQAKFLSQSVFFIAYFALTVKFLFVRQINPERLVRFLVIAAALLFGFYPTLLLPWYLTLPIFLLALAYGVSKKKVYEWALYLVSAGSFFLHLIIA